MLILNEGYEAIEGMPAFDADEPIPHGTPLIALARDTLLHAETGCRYILRELHHRYAGWYLTRITGFNPPPRTVPTLAEAARAAVRAHPGLDLEALYLLLTEPNPTAKPFTKSTLSGTLSNDKAVEMRRADGTVVTGLKHNERYTSFYPRIARKDEQR